MKDRGESPLPPPTLSSDPVAAVPTGFYCLVFSLLKRKLRLRRVRALVAAQTDRVTPGWLAELLEWQPSILEAH